MSQKLYPFNVSKIISKDVKLKRVAIAALSDLTSLICSDTWSPATFKFNYRKAANFIQTDLIVLDVDGGCTITSAKELFKSFAHIVATTKSHQVDKGGTVADRFRVILFLDKPITDKVTYQNLWNLLYSKYPFIDKSCSDTSRQWYPCKSIESVNGSGKLIEAVPVLGNHKSALESGKEEKSTILDSRRPKDFGSAYYKSIYRYLYRNVRWKKVSVAKVARYLANRVTGLKVGRERINQIWFAKHLAVNQTTASRLIKKLIGLRLIAVKQMPTTGFDSTVYRAGEKLKEILRVRNTATPTDFWKDGTAHAQMLRHIQWAFQNSYSRAEAVQFCLKMQGHRPTDKMRSAPEIQAVVNNWWTKAAKKVGAA